jgi:hypothetical protein
MKIRQVLGEDKVQASEKMLIHREVGQRLLYCSKAHIYS